MLGWDAAGPGMGVMAEYRKGKAPAAGGKGASADPGAVGLRSTAQHRTAPHSTAQHRTAPHRTVLHISPFQGLIGPIPL